MTDWGLPDWLDDSAYNPGGDWTLARWHWEFIRRWDEYRSEAVSFLSQMESGFSGDEQYEAWVRYWERWGYSSVLDPRVSEYPQHELLRRPHKGVSVLHGSPDQRISLRARIEPASNEIAVILNIDNPIEPQIKLARTAAKSAQIVRHGKLIDFRRHPVKWKIYLRVLDGRESGASWNELAAILVHTAQRHSNARDTYESACTLRNSLAY